MKIVVVMPTFNEASCIGGMIDAVMGGSFPRVHGAEMHLLIVDDSSDGTPVIVRERMSGRPRLHLIDGERKGLGWAYVRGMRYAMAVLQADAVIEMDADFQHDPAHLPEMAQRFLAGADYVIGSRYVPGGSVPASWPRHRRAMSAWGNRLIRCVLGARRIHDFTTGFRLTRVRGVLDRISLEDLMALDRFAFKVDLLFRSLHLARRVEEVPIRFGERAAGISKFSLREMTATLRVVVALRFGGAAS